MTLSLVGFLDLFICSLYMMLKYTEAGSAFEEIPMVIIAWVNTSFHSEQSS